MTSCDNRGGPGVVVSKGIEGRGLKVFVCLLSKGQGKVEEALSIWQGKGVVSRDVYSLK